LICDGISINVILGEVKNSYQDVDDEVNSDLLNLINELKLNGLVEEI